MNPLDIYDNLCDTQGKLDTLKSEFSRVIKRRTWYVEKHGLQIRRRWRSLDEIISKFTREADEEMEGFYRNHNIKLDDYQKAWLEKLMKKEYSFFLTIKLPWCRQSDFCRTQNKKEAIKLYKRLIKELMCIVTAKDNHCFRNPLQFEGCLEHGKSEKKWWHVHIAIQKTNNDEYIAYRLCEAISELVNKYNFFKTVFDLRCVYDKEGLCTYMVKELRKPTEYDDISYRDEDSELFTMQTWFGTKKLTNYKVNYFNMKINYLDIRQLQYVIGLAVRFKILGLLFWPNPVNKLKKKLIHKRANRRQRKVNSTTDLDPFGGPIGLLDFV